MRKLNRRTKVLAIGALALLGVVVTASGCGASNPAPLNSSMTAWGVQAGAVYDCYYVYTPLEVNNLIAQGRCPVNSIPVRAPESWLNLHFGYYDSPAYYNTYVPVSSRAYYQATWGGTKSSYYKSHTTVIINTNKAAKGVVPANPTKQATFGNGARATQTFGGGSRVTAPKPVSTYKPPVKAPTFGGGKRR